MRAKILVVDDMPEIQRFLSMLLGDAGYDVLAASTLKSGQYVVRQADPDLLIIDIRLGAYNGLQLALDQSISHPTRPIILISGHADPVLEAEAKRLGTEFLTKPIEPSLLLKAIERLLAQRQSSGERRWHPPERRFASLDRRHHAESVVHDRRTRGRRIADESP